MPCKACVGIEKKKAKLSQQVLAGGKITSIRSCWEEKRGID